MPALSLTLCGHVAVRVDGHKPTGAPLGTKCLALLAYLAIEPGPHSRDVLTALLWGEYPDARARASLRQALTHLREAIPDAIRVDRASVELVGDVECDVTTFLRLAKESPWAAADRVVSGFLGDLHPRHSAAFDEWADGVRATLARKSAEVLAAATREALATQQWRDGVRHAQRWVDLAPLSGSATSALMEAQFMNGDRALALDTFADYRARLAAEPGHRPERPVVELAERIEAAGAGAARRQATEEWYAAAPSFHGSLIGRDREWESLRGVWRTVREGRARIVLVEGDVGVGKTRLASDFLRWVAAEGGTVLRGRGYDARGGAPFGAMIEAVRSAIDAPGLAGTDPEWLAEVARMVPELRGRFPSLADLGATSGTDGWRLFESLAQVFVALAEEAPVAVLIDDLQWCDADSCTLLHFLVRRLEAVPVLWCLTFSPGSVERDASSARLVRALRAFRHAESVSLRPLSEEEVWQLVRALGRVSAPTGARRLAARMHEVTSGYPFYVIELLKTLFAQEWVTVDADTGAWIVRANAAVDAPALMLAPSVHEAIAERIECLPDELHGVLITIAVSARGCGADVLSHVHGISRLRAAATADALVERHLVVEEAGRYQCAHPVIARVVRDGLGTARRREVHRALALALAFVLEPNDDSVDPGDVARHAEEAGERGMAYRYAMLAAAACERRFAFEEALGWLDLASGMASGAEESDVVNRTTARLLARAGWRETPPAQLAATSPGQLAPADVDLPEQRAALVAAHDRPLGAAH